MHSKHSVASLSKNANDCVTTLKRKNQANTLKLSVLAAMLATLSFNATASVSVPDASSSVVISQVYGGGGNTGATYKNDFIELFNRSASPVSLNGWSVQYASAAGTSWNVTTLPNLVLQPGQYFLVQEAAGTGGTKDLPTPDKTGTLALSGTAGKVVLANVATAITSPKATSVLDLVAFGTTATPYEGAGPTPAPSNINAVLRAANGCGDTDQNATDFTAAVPNPRNSASPLNACSAPANAPIVTTCPATLDINAGDGGSITISAKDADGIVNSITLDNATNTSISLGNLTTATKNGDASNITLTVAQALGSGQYPVIVNFANNQSQSASCTIKVTVKAVTPAPSTTPISTIQGSGSSSSLLGQSVSTQGVVTLVMPNGFYLQDEKGDGNPETSDGIFVFTSTKPSVLVGDKLSLSATVAEFSAGDTSRTVTQLTSPGNLKVISSNNSITATNLSLPLAKASDWERYEGMLVRFVKPLTVSQNYFLGRYGQLTLSGSRLEKPTNRYPAGSAEAIAMAAANQANVIVLDDAASTQNPSPVPFLGEDDTVRAGDTVSSLTGVVDFGLITSSNPGPTGYKLQVVGKPVFSRENKRSTAPEAVSGNVKVSSFNVLNYFTTFQDGTTADGKTGQGCSLGNSVSKSNCRGADNAAEFTRQRAKIVSAMKAIDADVFGLMEMQNNGDVAVSNLVTELNKVISPSAPATITYKVVPVTAYTGSDAIRVAMIYKPAKLTLVGTALTDTDEINNRPPLAQTFALTDGKRFSVVVNHLKSKGSCPSDNSKDEDQGDGQGCWNALRVKQAKRLAEVFLPQVQAAANDTDVLTIGDLNAYGAEDPILELNKAGLVSEIERFVRQADVAPYSYIFDGESGYIDHALTTPSLSKNVASVTEWHINADEPLFIDYNTEFKGGKLTPDLYTVSPYRSSDHDPVVVGLNLQVNYSDFSAQLKRNVSGLMFNRATQSFNGTITFTNTGSKALFGPFRVELSGLTAGATLTNASGTQSGVSFINSNTGTLAAGQSFSVPVSFKYTGTTAISYQTKVLSSNQLNQSNLVSAAKPAITTSK